MQMNFVFVFNAKSWTYAVYIYFRLVEQADASYV